MTKTTSIVVSSSAAGTTFSASTETSNDFMLPETPTVTHDEQIATTNAFLLKAELEKESAE